MRRRVVLLVLLFALIGLLIHLARESTPADIDFEASSAGGAEASIESVERLPVPIPLVEESSVASGRAGTTLHPPQAPAPMVRREDAPSRTQDASSPSPPASGTDSSGAWSSAPALDSVYGVQAVFTGNVEVREARFDGQSQLSGIPSFEFEIERFVFVDDSASEPLRNYVACGLSIETTFNPKQPISSELECRSVRRREGGTVVLLPRESSEDERDLTSTRWDLGLASFVPQDPVRPGVVWILPHTALAEVLFAGGSLRLFTRDPGGAPEFPPFEWPTPTELAGKCSGTLTSTDQPSNPDDAPGRCVSRIEFDLRGECDGASWARKVKEAMGTPLSGLAVELAYTVAGIGVSIRNEIDRRPPQLELHAAWTADGSFQADVDDGQRRATLKLHAQGQIALLGGQRERNPELSRVVKEVREKFLADESFLLKP